MALYQGEGDTRLLLVRQAMGHLSEAEKALVAGQTGELERDSADEMARFEVERARALLSAPRSEDAQQAAVEGDTTLADAWGAMFIQEMTGQPF